MTSSREPVRVRLSGPLQLVAAIPAMLGFHPTDSVVIIGLRGEPRRRVHWTVRADCADAFARPAGVARWLAPYRCDEVVLTVFSAAAAESRPQVDALAAALRDVGLLVAEAGFVTAGRWRSYLCDDAACCPAEGTPLPDGPSPVAVAHAVQDGRAVLPDREALASSIRPDASRTGASMDQAVDRVLQEQAGAGRGIPPEETVAGFGAARARYADPPATLDRDEAARLAVGLLEVAARDALLPLCTDPEDDALYALLHDLCRLTPPYANAPAATLLAAAAYSRGDGALANVAVDQALEADPGYRMALLLSDALARLVPPPQVRAALAAQPLPDAAAER